MLPLLLLIVRLLKHNQLLGIRVKGRALETPVVYYEHPKTKQKVVFVATIHLAEAEYYAKLQELIDSLISEGYVVLYEGVGSFSEEQANGLDEAKRKVWEQTRLLFQAMDILAELMGLQYQRDGISYQPGWINTDMSFKTLVDLFVAKGVSLSDKEIKIAELIENDRDRSLVVWIFNKLLQWMPVWGVIFYMRGILVERQRRIKDILIKKRNKIAWDGIQKQPAESNVLTIWGAEHWRGIHKKLTGEGGFRKIKTEWRAAYRFRNYRLSDYL